MTLLALRQILYVLQKKTCWQGAIYSANDFFHLPKLSQVSQNFEDAIK